MLAEDVINQLQVMLPKFTDKFTASVAIASITSSGLVATLTTSAVHGLVAGNQANIVGALSPVNITSITKSGNIATATTAQDHDLTEGFFDTVTIAGTSKAIFNGTFPFLTQVNRRTFTFTVTDPLADFTATADFFLGGAALADVPLSGEEGNAFATGGQLTVPGAVGGYNGLKTVLTAPTTTSFTYALDFVQPNDAFPSTGEIRKGIRISGAVDHDRAKKAYTKQSTGKFWAFVYLEDTSASKDRHGENDAISSHGTSGSERQQIIQAFLVEIFIPSTGDITGRLARDDAESLVPSIYKSLVGAKIPTGLSDSGNLGVYFVNSGTIEYTTAYYVYGMRFQILTEIGQADSVDQEFSVAFRDISLTQSNTFGDQLLTAALDLDDEPL